MREGVGRHCRHCRRCHGSAAKDCALLPVKERVLDACGVGPVMATVNHILSDG
jgi:hypothetical protein